MGKYTVLFLLLFSRLTQAQEMDSLFFQESHQSNPPALVKHYRMPAEPFMKTRLHLVSDFLRKFNDTTATEECPWAETARSIRLRELFSPVSIPDVVYRKQAFIEAMGLKKLLKPQENLYAEVTLLVSHKGQNTRLKIYLKKQKSRENWSWQVVGSEPIAVIGNPIGEKVDSTQFIAPNAHELNFMSLPQLLQKDIRPFIAREALVIPEVQKLISSVYQGELRIIQSQKTILYLDTQVGWYLQLQQFNQESEYSGWLIDDVYNQPTELPVPLRVFLQHDNK